MSLEREENIQPSPRILAKNPYSKSLDSARESKRSAVRIEPASDDFKSKMTEGLGRNCIDLSSFLQLNFTSTDKVV